MQIHYKNTSFLEDDIALWQEFSEGSELAYEHIYHKYVSELFRYAYMVVKDKSLAEDVIHDVFTDLWSSREKLGKVRSVRLYLFSSVKRRALRKLKKENVFSDFDLSAAQPSPGISASFLDELIDVQQKETLAAKVKKCLAGLSNRQREIIYLRFYQDMSYDEIAQLLQLDQKYIYNLASKAFGILRKSIPPIFVVYVLLIIDLF
ncbi:RNA polymerase sigma factor [Cesiribacter sp. SM1]|uniref:RNA polymerase sigma factor n=1 Tax=Cesiribacter sp. SM1 TaxID=2861196 RepID=UPI001CD3139B|nr:sigma-70 family RNA polymerase sigma factor [Cesiribacter sp. SM1]